MEGATRYRIDYTIDAGLNSLHGEQAILYTDRENQALQEVELRLLPNVLNGRMQVSGLSVEGAPAQGSYALDDSLLRVPLEQELLPGQQVELSLTFAIELPTELESNYGILAFYDGVLTLAHCYAMVAVFDDEGWNAEIPPDQGDPTYADASFFEVNVDAPEDLVLVASGRELSHEKLGDRQRVSFAAGPARDFYLAASPDYASISETIAGITFNSYAPADDQAGAQAALEYAVAAFKVFEARYAPYPYTEFDLIATPTYALGIEYPGIVAITDRLYNLNGSLSGISNQVLIESVIVHEAGHQWFYNLVGNDQLDEPWLDESLAQFITWQYFTDRYGEDGANGFEASLRERWSRVDNQPIPIGLPVSEYAGASYGAIVYGRGALFFEALREQLGEPAFDDFLRAYTQENSWGIGTGDEMQALAESYCDCDLAGLFAEWVNP